MRLFALGIAILAAGTAVAADPPAQPDRLPAGAVLRLGTLRARAPISSFGIEKDGTVVTADGTQVRRWRLVEDTSEEPIALPLPGNARQVGSSCVSPDGKLVAAGTEDKLFVWEVPADAKAKPKEVASFSVGEPWQYRFSPDGTKLLVIHWQMRTGQRFAFLCDVPTRQAQALEGGDLSGLEAIGFSGDGKRAVGACRGKYVLWDVATGKLLADRRPESQLHGSFALDRTGAVLVVKALAGREWVWQALDPLTGKANAGFKVPPSGERLAFSPDGKTLLASGSSGVSWWNPDKGEQIRAFAGYVGWHDAARFTPDGKTVVAHNGHVLLRWDAATGKPLVAEQDAGHGHGVNGLGVSPDGKLIATRGYDGRLCVWDAAAGKELWRAEVQWSNVASVAFGPDGKHLFAPGLKDAHVVQFEAATGKIVRTFALDPKARPFGVESVRVSADGKTVFGLSSARSLDEPGMVTAWDTATGARLREVPFRGKRGIGEGCELSPNGAFVARGAFSGGGVVAVADPDVDLLAEAKIDRPSSGSGHFSDDGKWLTMITRKTVKDESGEARFEFAAVVVDTPTWRAVRQVTLGGSTRAAALSPDGRTLAVATGERIEFYDVTTGQLFGQRQVPPGDWKHRMSFVQVLRFTPDGTKLVSGHTDTTALVWTVPPRPGK